MQALHVPRDENFQGALCVDLCEIRHMRPDFAMPCTVWRDCGSNGNDAVPRQQFANETNAALSRYCTVAIWRLRSISKFSVSKNFSPLERFSFSPTTSSSRCLKTPWTPLMRGH